MILKADKNQVEYKILSTKLYFFIHLFIILIFETFRTAGCMGLYNQLQSVNGLLEHQFLSRLM